MAKMESSLSFSKEISSEVDKRYPKASKAVLKNLKRYIRNLNILVLN
jgi:hypothetical protein